MMLKVLELYLMQQRVLISLRISSMGRRRKHGDLPVAISGQAHLIVLFIFGRQSLETQQY